MKGIASGPSLASAKTIGAEPRFGVATSRRHPSYEDTRTLALQLRYRKFSESMGNHDSEIVDAGSVD